MNGKRILLGGLAGGVLMVLIDGFFNAVVFARDFADAYQALGLPRENPAIPAYWISFDLVMGLTIAWLYAALRPRFGAGPKTALYAGLLEWFMVHATLFSHLADRVFPARPLLGAGAGELIAAVLGALVAGALYRERP
jgi:hypothetical protein